MKDYREPGSISYKNKDKGGETTVNIHFVNVANIKESLETLKRRMEGDRNDTDENTT